MFDDEKIELDEEDKKQKNKGQIQPINSRNVAITKLFRIHNNLRIDINALIFSILFYPREKNLHYHQCMPANEQNKLHTLKKM